MTLPDMTRRRGLPRVAGGSPWPEPYSSTAPASTTRDVVPNVYDSGTDVPASAGGVVARRRGLPRVEGGERWPSVRPPLPIGSVAGILVPAAVVLPPGSSSSTTAGTSAVSPAQRRVRGDLLREPKPERRLFRGRTRARWAMIGVSAGGGLLVAAAVVVFFVRWLMRTPPLQSFLIDYPGEYHLPEWAPVGMPPWLNWAHFFNAFLMALVIRSGWQIRTDQRPSAFWAPRWNPQRRVSLTIWFHQALDILWIVNGVVFVVMLLVTGQWVKIVPTSWSAFPNALSAGLQYMSLDWPTENGWVNYNSLQQLTYFTTVFLAAPLAAATGVRMSGLWSTRRAQRLSKA